MKLARIDFQTTDLSALRAAVVLPSSLRPLPGKARLRVTVSEAGRKTVQRDLALEQVDDPEAATLNVESGGAQRLCAYRLTPDGVRSLETFRREAASNRSSPKAKRRLSLSVSADACHTAASPSGPLLITSYLKTQETKSFVPLVRNYDLRTLSSGTPLRIMPCT